MKSSEFILWLTHDRDCAQHVARDVESRCRRIERVMSTSLDDAVRDDAVFSQLLTRLQSEAPTFLGPSKNPKGALSVLTRAAKLYREFLEKSPNA